jgi:cytidylate kinase
MRVYYGVNWLDDANYDLSIDTATFGRDASAEVIVRAAQVFG